MSSCYSSTMPSGQILLEVKRYEVQTKLCIATMYADNCLSVTGKFYQCLNGHNEISDTIDYIFVNINYPLEFELPGIQIEVFCNYSY